MIDSHCHLDHSPLFENLKEVVNESHINGVKFLLIIPLLPPLANITETIFINLI